MNHATRILAEFFRRAAGKLQRLHLRLAVGPRQREVDRWFADRGDLRLRLDYPLTENDVVWDVGAYEGQWASDIVAKYGCRVQAFEAMPEFQKAIRDRFAHNPRITVQPYGLGATDTTVTLQAASDQSSHLHPGLADANVRPVEARIRDIRQVHRELGGGVVALLKINIEGAEYELLEALLAGGLAGQFVHLQIQFHDFVPQAGSRREAIVSALQATHERTWCYPFVWENWTRKK